MVCISQHHRDRFPPAQLLDRIDIDACLNEPRGKGMSQVMEAEPRDPRLPHRRIERPQQIARLSWVPRLIDEHRLCAVRPHRGAGLQDFHRRIIHRQRVPRAIFLLQDRERVTRQIHVGPLQRQDLPTSHSRMEREHDDLLEPDWRGREQPLLFLRGQPALNAIADLLLAGRAPATAVAEETDGDSSPWNQESPGAGFHGRRLEHQMGHRSHRQSHGRALALSLCRARLIFGPGGGVVDECASGPPTGGSGGADGPLATPGSDAGHPALGSGLSVYVRGVPTVLGGPSHYRQHECRGQLRRQCGSGELLRGAQARAGESATLPDQSGSKSGYLRRHRTVSQSPAAAKTGAAATDGTALNSTVRGNGVEPHCGGDAQSGVDERRCAPSCI